MPSATSKGKKPLSEVMEYDPHHQAAPGKPRVKHQKGTSKASVAGKQKHVQS